MILAEASPVVSRGRKPLSVFCAPAPCAPFSSLRVGEYHKWRYMAFHFPSMTRVMSITSPVVDERDLAWATAVERARCASLQSTPACMLRHSMSCLDLPTAWIASSWCFTVPLPTAVLSCPRCPLGWSARAVKHRPAEGGLSIWQHLHLHRKTCCLRPYLIVSRDHHVAETRCSHGVQECCREGSACPQRVRLPETRGLPLVAARCRCLSFLRGNFPSSTLVHLIAGPDS